MKDKLSMGQTESKTTVYSIIFNGDVESNCVRTVIEKHTSDGEGEQLMSERVFRPGDSFHVEFDLQITE